MNNPVNLGDIYGWWDAEDMCERYYMIVGRRGDSGPCLDVLDLLSGQVYTGDEYDTYADMNCVVLLA